MRVYSEVPRVFSGSGTPLGSNERIYHDFVNELKENEDGIKEVHLVLYLFNNIILYSELLRLAKKGIKVIVTTIPLTGYQERKQKEAQIVYSKALNDSAIDLRIFPHKYVWYGANYAEGGASYSLHIKAGIISYGATCKVFLTSGNMALGDPSHSETAMFIEASSDSSTAVAFARFFDELEKRAIPYSKYTDATSKLTAELGEVFDFCFVGGTIPINLDLTKVTDAFFTAPFICIGGDGSNNYARKRIVQLISSAKRRVLICSQHSHDLAPFDGCRDQTMIESIINAKKQAPNIDARVIKQVSSSGLADKRRAAFVESHLYYAGVCQRFNKLIHDKFIVTDDTAVVATGNFTATQFGWGLRSMECETRITDLEVAQRLIDYSQTFFGTPKGYVTPRISKSRKGKFKIKVRKRDFFSEVNGFLVVRDSSIVDQLASHFDSLWGNRLSKEIEVLVRPQ